MHLHRKPSIRRREKKMPADTEYFPNKILLSPAAPCMLDYGTAENDVELSIGEWQGLPGLNGDECQSWILMFQMTPILGPDTNDIILERVKSLKII